MNSESDAAVLDRPINQPSESSTEQLPAIDIEKSKQLRKDLGFEEEFSFDKFKQKLTNKRKEAFEARKKENDRWSLDRDKVPYIEQNKRARVLLDQVRAVENTAQTIERQKTIAYLQAKGVKNAQGLVDLADVEVMQSFKNNDIYLMYKSIAEPEEHTFIQDYERKHFYEQIAKKHQELSYEWRIKQFKGLNNPSQAIERSLQLGIYASVFRLDEDKINQSVFALDEFSAEQFDRASGAFEIYPVLQRLKKGVDEKMPLEIVQLLADKSLDQTQQKLLENYQHMMIYDKMHSSYGAREELQQSLMAVLTATPEQNLHRLNFIDKVVRFVDQKGYEDSRSEIDINAELYQNLAAMDKRGLLDETIYLLDEGFRLGQVYIENIASDAHFESQVKQGLKDWPKFKAELTDPLSQSLFEILDNYGQGPVLAKNWGYGDQKSTPLYLIDKNNLPILQTISQLELDATKDRHAHPWSTINDTVLHQSSGDKLKIDFTYIASQLQNIDIQNQFPPQYHKILEYLKTEPYAISNFTHSIFPQYFLMHPEQFSQLLDSEPLTYQLYKEISHFKLKYPGEFVPELVTKKFFDPKTAPPQLRDLALLCRSLGWQSHNLMNDIDKWEKYYKNGLPQKALFQAFEGTDYLKGTIYESILTEEVLARMTPDTRAFWSKAKALPMSMLRIFVSAPNFDPANVQDNDVQKIEKTAHLFDQILGSPSKEVVRLSEQLLAQLMTVEDPEKMLTQINAVFVHNHLPATGKVFRVFELLYPPERIDRMLKNPHNNVTLSPQLSQPQTRRVESPERQARERYDMVYRDLLSVDIESANQSLYAYLHTLQSGQGLFDQAVDDISGLNNHQRDQLGKFIDQLDTLLENSLYGRTLQPGDTRNLDLEERIKVIQQNYRLNGKQSLSERITQMFIHPLGYRSIEDVLTRMDVVKDETNYRNLELAESSGAEIKLAEADLLKGVQSNNLSLILSTGIKSREFLGASADSDLTPFGTDFSRVLENEVADNYDFKNIVDHSLATGYGDIILVIKDRGQFSDSAEPSQSKSRYERYPSGFHGPKHYDVRTGLPSTEIDAIVIRGYSKDRDQSKLERMAYEITQNGFYVPICDDTGKILFTPQEYEKYQIKSHAVESALEAPEFSSEKLIAALSQSKYLAKLYESDTGVSEKYSLAQHSQMVLNQFEKYFANNWDTLPIAQLMTKENFRLLLAIHDLGKPLSVIETGSTRDQHAYTMKFAGPLLERLKINPKQADLVLGVISNDFLGEYMFRNARLENTAERMKSRAKSLGISGQTYLEFCYVYYMCDGSSYTTNAGGQDGSGSMFDFGSSEEPKIEFTPSMKEKYESLLRLLA